jgi:dGTP triphosphohydrolase
MIARLYGVYEGALRSGNLELFPVGFQELVKAGKGVAVSRWAADYISGLTEQRVVELSQRLAGQTAP